MDELLSSVSRGNKRGTIWESSNPRGVLCVEKRPNLRFCDPPVLETVYSENALILRDFELAADVVRDQKRKVEVCVRMAYATLVSLENIIDQILDHDRFSISPHEKKQIIYIDKCVISLRAFLEDFPNKAKILEARIRDVAAEAEDIIECFLLDQIRYSYGYTKWIAILREIMFKYQLQKVRAEMDSIAAEAVEIKNSIKVKHQQVGDSVGATPSSQVADTGKTNVVGFNKDLIAIKDKLCRSAPQLQVLPIIGMGGIGKTTLARNAYDDQLIIEHFQIRVWVTVSQDYSYGRILLDLLDSIKEFDQESMEEDDEQDSEKANSLAENSEKEKVHELRNSEMALKVHKILTCNRFLIVMDDVWSPKVLDDVKHLFPNYNNGSRIMLTTRLIKVAKYVGSSILPHEMRLMDADQSWDLLWKKVFIDKDRIPRELEKIGREIARSCGGLPLTIVVIAGLLSTMSKITSWKEVARNIRSSLATTDGQIEKILSLSYSHLPHHLRPCFLYMGGFPEDHEIKATDLIRLWIAESFVRPLVSKRLEDNAEGYLEDLVNRSLIVVTKRKSNGNIKCCSLHDMVREMCVKLSQEEKFLVHVKGSGALKLLKRVIDQRRISISHSDLNSLSNTFSSTIRTIIYFQDELRSFGSFRLLRVLDVLGVQFESRLLPDQFFELFHLRYLAFCYSNPIPRAISNLQSLQTLIIKEVSDDSMPYEIWNMPQLRHLIVYGTHLADTNANTSSLENLQTLRVQNLICSISKLNLIPNLTKLWLTYSYESRELFLHKLVHLSRLEKLHLELGYGRRDSVKPNLVVPRSLKKLTLKGWGRRGPYLDMVGPFPNLEVLKLTNFDFMGQEWRTNDKDFPQLKFLLIKESNITQWETESGHFPRLKSLHFHSCWDLSEIPECIGEIPTLELIDLKLYTESLADSVKRIQEEAQSYGDDSFQVRYSEDDDVPVKEMPSRVKFEVAMRFLLKRRRVRPVEGPEERLKSSIRSTLLAQSAALKFMSAVAVNSNLVWPRR